MSQSATTLHAIPTNVISGFLGVGKTTTILSLLKNKPVDERWAVLVNEYGEIGLDGAIIQGQQTCEGDVHIHEVPGGCMCCASGLPMPAALNQLLTRAKPHRLLIEPSGLGHPEGVLEVLRGERYQDVLDVQQSITLVDARNISDSRYTEHENFQQHIDIADVIVANKCDLYGDEEFRQLTDYVAQRRGAAMPPIVKAENGNIDPALLQGNTVEFDEETLFQALANGGSETVAPEEDLPASGYVKKRNMGEGFQTVGWRFAAEHVLRRDAVLAWLESLQADRIKAVLITDEGALSFNQSSGLPAIATLQQCGETRIEIIAQHMGDEWETELFNCFINPPERPAKNSAVVFSFPNN